ncbi:hypothetical protein RRG08_033983 [Elysia crispata]|uniref:Uncharacterized protein n=1 Tax=Elysia crispata TaxID=231223 RepID=A0AAE1D402_9GAST|nr:hypothetical protein RRG08_033983 [Elysia crispata]
MCPGIRVLCCPALLSGTVVQTSPRSVSIGQHLYSRRETYSGRLSNTPTAPTPCERQTVDGEKTLEVTTQRKSRALHATTGQFTWLDNGQVLTTWKCYIEREDNSQERGVARVGENKKVKCGKSCDEAKSQQSVTELPLHTSQEQLNQGLSRCSPSCDEAESQQSVTELPLHTSQEQLNQGLSRCSPSCDEAKSQQSVTELPLHTSQEQLNQGLSRCSPSCDEAKSQQSVTELPLHTSQEQLNQGASSVSLASEYGARTGCDVVAAST